MKKSIVLRNLRIIVLVIVMLIGAVTAGATSKGEVIKATFMSVYPASHQQYVLTCNYLDMVEEATKGKIKFERYSSHQLVPSRQALDATGQGMIDILNSYSGYYSGSAGTGSMGFPGGWPNPASWAYNFLNDPDLRNLVSKQYLEKVNVVVPLMHTFVPGSCFIMDSGKEIRKADDFQGKKIRAPGGAIPNIYKELGAAGVTLIGAEWYTAMQRGTVDGVMGYPYAIRTYKLLEVAGSMTKLRMVATICPMIFVNADFWKGLSQEIKDIMISVNKKWTWKVMMPAVTEEESKDWKLGKAKGLEIIQPSQDETAKILAVAARIGRKTYIDTCTKQGYGEVAQKIVSKMEKATVEWPALEKRLLEEGKISKGKYMYPAN